jgi:hypothetical protein
MSMLIEANHLAATSMVGGKGHHLQKLVSWGAPVPDFFILTTVCYDHFLATGNLPEELEERFALMFRHADKIALRSSMISEDQLDSSFAGLFETILDVRATGWKEALLKIYHSVTSPRVLEYIALKKLQVELKMAVVAQVQVDVERSGVIFTRSPVPPTGAVAIDAAFGMGEGVVSGLVPVDNYLLIRSGELIKKITNNEPQVLKDEELQGLLRMALDLEDRIGLPCDVEWGICQGKIHVFQIRPITRSFDKLTWFVDTNLSESYPGIVSPFTASFVKRAYENVFKESAVILGASGRRLDTLCYHYARLISCVDDHLYYNLEHYYAILRALPGGEKNISNWHQMIGGKIEGSHIPYHNTILSKRETIATIVSLTTFALKRKRAYPEFLARAAQLQEEIQLKQASLDDARQTAIYLSQLIDRPLGFGITVVNDLFIMVGLGFLTASLKKKGLPEEKVIDLLKTSQNVDSLKPLEVFNQLVQGLSAEFLAALEGFEWKPGFRPFDQVFNQLTTTYPQEVALVREFLHDYGDRSFEE